MHDDKTEETTAAPPPPAVEGEPKPGDTEEANDKEMESLPPLRMHVKNRLSGSGRELLAGTAAGAAPPSTTSPTTSTPTGTPRMAKRRTSLERKKSRSASPSLRKSGAGTSTTAATSADGNSSLSSLDDSIVVTVDSDLLTDKMGLEELDIEKQHSSSQLMIHPSSSLPPVSERLCDETLEDVHAFSDVKRDGTHSRGASSIATGGDGASFLETLEEMEEIDDDEEESIDEEGDKVILTNMENITISKTGTDGDDESKREDESRSNTVPTA